jgi:hypothetical protein
VTESTDERPEASRRFRRLVPFLAVVVLGAVVCGAVVGIRAALTKAYEPLLATTANSGNTGQASSTPIVPPTPRANVPKYPSRDSGRIEVECPQGRFGYSVDVVDLGLDKPYSSMRDVTASGTFTNLEWS